jgi:translation elongation factor EF-Tu-like GTPase
VSVGDAVDVRSKAQAVRSVVAGIEADHKALRSARAGDQVAVLLKQFSPDQVSDGLKRVGEPPVWQVVELALYGLPKPWWKFW